MPIDLGGFRDRRGNGAPAGPVAATACRLSVTGQHLVVPIVGRVFEHGGRQWRLTLATCFFCGTNITMKEKLGVTNAAGEGIVEEGSSGEHTPGDPGGQT